MKYTDNAVFFSYFAKIIYVLILSILCSNAIKRGESNNDKKAKNRVS